MAHDVSVHKNLAVVSVEPVSPEPEKRGSMDLVKGSLDRKLQRPLLGKSRTLPSIPQSPVLSRVPLLDSKLYREDMPEQKQYKNHSASDCQKGCTVPSTGEAWRLEDDCMDSVGDPALRPQLRTAVDEAPFSYFRTRSFYMRKSLSVDNHLSSLSYSIHPSETKAERVKTKLRRQFSLGSADKKDFYQQKTSMDSYKEPHAEEQHLCSIFLPKDPPHLCSIFLPKDPPCSCP